RRVLVMPQLLGRAGVKGPDIVWRRDVQDAVHQNRRSLDHLVLAGLEFPELLKIADVRWGNLRQAAVPAALIIAVIRQPGVRRRMNHHLLVDILGARQTGSEEQPEDRSSGAAQIDAAGRFSAVRRSSAAQQSNAARQSSAPD